MSEKEENNHAGHDHAGHAHDHSQGGHSHNHPHTHDHAGHDHDHAGHDHDHDHDHAGHDHSEHGDSEDDSSSDLSSTGGRDNQTASPPPPPPITIPTPKTLDDGRVDCFPEDPLKVVKTIQKQGDGEVPPVNAMVFVHYTGTLLDGNKFDSSRDRNQPFSFKLGVGQVIKGWDYGVSSMKVGEISDLEIHSDYAYGDNGSPPTIPAKATLRFNVELLSFDKEPDTPEEKIAFAAARKDEGNAFVKQQKWSEALHAYDRGIPHVLHISSKSEEIQKKRREVHDQLQSNKALCCIKLDKTEEGLLACDEVLRVDQTNAKVWYRRALLFQKRGDWPRSRYDLVQAAYNSPKDAVIRAELDRVKAYLKEQEDKERKKYSNMFERIKKMEGQEELEKKKRDEEAIAQEKKWAEEQAIKKKAAEEAKKKRIEEKRKKRLAAEEEKKKKEAAAAAAAAATAAATTDGAAATVEKEKEAVVEEKKEVVAEQKKEAVADEKKEEVEEKKDVISEEKKEAVAEEKKEVVDEKKEGGENQ